MYVNVCVDILRIKYSPAFFLQLLTTITVAAACCNRVSVYVSVSVHEYVHTLEVAATAENRQTCSCKRDDSAL